MESFSCWKNINQLQLSAGHGKQSTLSTQGMQHKQRPGLYNNKATAYNKYASIYSYQHCNNQFSIFCNNLCGYNFICICFCVTHLSHENTRSPCTGGNMIFVYYGDRAGPTEFIIIKSLPTFYDYHEFFAEPFF